MLLQKFNSRLRPRMDVELFVDMAQVAADRFDADSESVRDFFVEAAFRQMFEHLQFAFRELLGFVFLWSQSMEILDHFSCDMGGHWRSALVRFLDRLEEFVRGGPLDDVTTCPIGERLENQIHILIHREHQELAPWQLRLKPAHTFDAAHLGQVNIHQDDIRLLTWNKAQSIFSAAMLSAAFKPLNSAKQDRQAFANALIIFNNGNFDRHDAFDGRRSGAEAADNACAAMLDLQSHIRGRTKSGILARHIPMRAFAG